MMHNFKNIILFAIPVAVMLSAPPVRAAEDYMYRYEADSLRAILPSLESGAKLQTLWGIARAERDAQNGTEAEKYAVDRFLEEARLQKNRDMEAQALMMLLLYYHNNDDMEQYFAMSEDVGEFLLDNGYMDLYWEYLFVEVKSLLHANRQESALRLTDEMYDLAKSQNDIYGLASTVYLMGKSYQFADKSDLAIEAFLEAWSYIKQVKDPTKRTRLAYHCAVALVIEFNFFKQYDRSLVILDEWAQNVEESKAWVIKTDENTITTDVSQIYCNILYAETYALTGRFEEAEKYLARVETVVDRHTPIIKNFYLITKRIIHEAKGEHEDALAVDAKLKEYYAGNGDIYMYSSTMSDIWQSLKALERYEEAVAVGDEIMMLSDSLYSIEHLKQLNELKTVYEVDKLQAQKQRQTIVIISVSVGCFLLAVIIAVYVVYSLNLKRKNISLYNKIHEMARAEREAERILELIPEAELSREMKLFRELTNLMHSEKLFLDPAVDRRSLAARLGTNEKYLANAIHEGAPDTTFTGYISGLRLAYSLDLLSNPGMTLEAVAEGSGHGSYSTFFRAFGKRYGMSPSEYRRLFSEKSA